MKLADRLFGAFRRSHRSVGREGMRPEAEVDRGATFDFTLGSREQSTLENVAIATEA